MKRDTDGLERALEMLVRNRLDTAERLIEGLKPKDEYEAGYLKGLRGILNGLQKPSKGRFIGAFEKCSEMHLEGLLESIEAHYLSWEEEGYFAAWADFLRKLFKRK